MVIQLREILLTLLYTAGSRHTTVGPNQNASDRKYRCRCVCAVSDYENTSSLIRNYLVGFCLELDSNINRS